MKTKHILIIAFVAILMVATLTNPSNEDHKQKVTEVFTTYYEKSLQENGSNTENPFSALGNLLGKSLINTIVENSIKRDNYIIFSVTKIAYDGEEKSIGYGIFGNVFLSDKIEDTLNKNLNQ